MSSPLREALRGKRVLVCVGPGGVGKTTVAATLGLRAAVEGREALVCTIDPAKRLANALGIDAFSHHEATISVEAMRAAGLSPKATLRAMMLDMKRTWDELIERLAAPDKRERILQNRFYQALSSALAGSQEYIAMEKVWELHQRPSNDLIVLDTPPTAHALDFLDAPNRVLDFLDNEAARWLLTPALAAGKIGLQLFNLGGSYVARTLSRLTGAETLQELASFMLAISGMNEEFRQRAQQVKALMAAPETAFILVTSPAPERLDEVLHFLTLFKQSHMNVAAIVVNRMHAPPPDGAAARTLPAGLREKIERTLAEQDVLARHDKRALDALEKESAPTPLVRVPRFDVDVHDLPALWRTSEYLMAEPKAHGSRRT